MTLVGQPSFRGTDRFELIRLLGQGGMGVVYEALDHQQGGSVAIKLLPLVSPERLLRFKREFRAAAEIHHPNLVRLGELVRAGDHWFFSMELVPGEDILTYVRGPAPADAFGSQATIEDSTLGITTGPQPIARRMAAPPARWGESFDEQRLRQSARELASGLSALHRAGCVHRDIKPSNVLVTPQGRTVLLDFGLASVGSNESSMLSAGTPLYMAPEQASQQPATPATDWYGFGVLVFELLTGGLPFSGHIYEVLAAKQSVDAPPVRSVEPNVPADLARLVDALLVRDPAMRPGATHILEALGAEEPVSGSLAIDPHAVERQALVGRENELGQLQALLDRVADTAAPIALVIRGESGVGKSCLARRFVAQASASEQALAFSGRCHERELVPFNAVDGVFDALAHTLRHMRAPELDALIPPRAGVLAQVFPVLARVPQIAHAPLPGQNLDRREVRGWLFEAARSVFQGLGKARPVIVFIDDLQWADHDSLALLSEVMRKPDGPRILLVCTLRTQASVGPRLDAPLFSKDVEERVITLDNLSEGDARALANKLLPAGCATDERSAWIARESGGHPLFLRELVEETLTETGNAAELGLEAVLLRRIARLPDAPRRVLESLAVASRPIRYPVLRDASGVDARALPGAVHALRIDRLVHVANESGRETLFISHERIRRAVRDALAAEQQQAIHLALARSLEANGEPASSAWHWHEVGDNERAARHYRSAGQRAMEALAFAEAESHLRAAHDLFSFDRATESELLAELGDALAHAGRAAEAADQYRKAAVYARSARAIELKRRAAEELVRSGHLEEGRLVGREALRDAQLDMPRAPLRDLLLERARLRLRGLRPSELPITDADTRAHELARVDLCWSFFCGLILTDHLRGAYFQAKALHLALESGDRYRIARALAAEASYSESLGPSKRAYARRLFERAEALTHEVDRPQALGNLYLMQGIAAHMTGRFALAAKQLEASSRTFQERCTGVSWELDASRQFLLESTFYLGKLSAFRADVHRNMHGAEERGSKYSMTNLRTGLPNAVWLMDDDVTAARCELGRAMDQWSNDGFHVQHWYALLAAAHADLYEGRGAEAFQRIDERHKHMERSHLLRVRHIATVFAYLRACTSLASLATLTDVVLQKKRLLLVAESIRTLRKDCTPWTEALAELLTFACQRFSPHPPTAEDAARARGRLVAAELGVFVLAFDCLVQGDAAGLSAHGVRAPDRFARMLLPL
jgi:tetratricopeptide (TPR) repeat protein